MARRCHRERSLGPRAGPVSHHSPGGRRRSRRLQLESPLDRPDDRNDDRHYYYHHRGTDLGDDGQQPDDGLPGDQAADIAGCCRGGLGI